MREYKIELVISEKMDKDEKEHPKWKHPLIRFSEQAKKHLNFVTETVEFGQGDQVLNLKIASVAYQEDIDSIRGKIKAGEVPKGSTKIVGFVSTKSFNAIRAIYKDQEIWVSNSIEHVSLGCDPEFILVDGNKNGVRADAILPNSRHDPLGEDGPNIEVRPPPSRSHLTVVRNIADILRGAPDKVRKLKWVGGATYRDANREYWMGGHIHIGRPVQVPEDLAPGLFKQMAVILDDYLAFPMLRFDFPNPEKRRSMFGKARDIRYNYPNYNRFEYRVLSGLWLTHPKLARIVLGAAKCIAESAYSKLADKNFDMEWATNPGADNLSRSFGAGSIRRKNAIDASRRDAVEKGDVRAWAEAMRKLEFYPKYKEDVEALILLTRTRASDLMAHMDLNIKNNWLDNKPFLAGIDKPLVEEKINSLEV